MKEKSFFKKEGKKSNSKLMKTEMKQILRCVSLSQYAAFLSVFPNSNILSSFNSSKYSIQILIFNLYSLRIETLTCNKLSHCLFDFECPDFDE
jgi:predicted transcriptional regulator